MKLSQTNTLAFTLVDLLAVLAALALCVLLLAPALARTRTDARAFQCLNNNRELNRAWRLCIADNQERLPYSSENPADSTSYAWAWVTGTMDFSPNNRANWDPSVTIMKSPLWPYCGINLNIWRCPSDRSYVVVNGVPKTRLRSCAMNVYLGGWGGTDGGWPMAAGYRLYLKLTDIVIPAPAGIFVFVDMREDSITWGNFFTDMTGYFPRSPAQYEFYDLPGAYHNGGANFSFADGHGESRRWQDPRTVPPLQSGLITIPTVPIVSPNNADIAWFQDHATRPK
jgi:prepilin-type processing-associated H-X9-DG protein